MYGFEESVAIRRQDLTNNKTDKGTFFVNIKLIDLFVFADQEKMTYGLGYTLALKRKINNDSIIGNKGVDAAKTVMKDIGWYIQHITSSLEKQQHMMDLLLNKDPTKLYKERIVSRKDVNANNI